LGVIYDAWGGKYMFCQLFGNYLFEEDVISKDEYQKLIEEQMSVRVRLGTIAVMEGILSEEEVEKINQLQRTQDRRFGDIAVEQGLLSDTQVSALLVKQGDVYMQFVQLLMDMLSITKEEIEDHIENFRKKIGFTPEEMEILKKDELDELLPMFVISSKPYVLDIAGLFTRNITRFVSRDFYIEKARKVKEYKYAHLACQELVGDDSVFVAVAEADEQDKHGAFLQIASSFGKQEMVEVDADAYDSVCEFINVTSGLLATSLSDKGISIDMEPPLGFENQTVNGDFYVLPIIVEGRRLDILIAVNSEFEAGDGPLKLGAVSAPYVPEDESHGAERVLIVDDSKMSRQILRNILETDGYEVVMEAANGLEGVEAYKKYNPDVVTLDITMPEMDGLEALEKILDYDPDANVVMITAAGQQAKLIKALKVGAKRFISKPFDENEILTNIKEMMAR
jgi:CheY-like chemotaxis protein